MSAIEHDKPAVSVLMRTFNRAGILSRAIESVLRQSWTDLELIVIDDCSTDETRAVIEAYRRRDQRVVPIHRPRNSRNCQPREEPMNDGLAVARGRFIAYLDDDNLWRRGYLDVLCGYLATHPEIALVYCDTCDHYSAAELEAALSTEKRRATAKNMTSFVIPHEPQFTQLRFSDSGRGYLDYVDTNEMVHTADALRAAGGGWRLRHPLADRINAVQGARFSYRSHNDLDLVERIVGHFGPERVKYIPEVLVDFVDPTHPRYTDANARFCQEESYSY